MKRIISTMAMVCLSFSCFAEDYFVKVADNEYVLQHGEKSKDLGTYDIGIGRPVAAVDAVYTPTHIFTYPDGTPAHFRNIQKIDYTESNVTFYKDIKSRKCCIDIYDDEKNPNKCRIIGVNGHNITGKDNNNFEVYDVAEEANSFTDSKQRLIYVDHSGLYIVEKDKNAVEDISKNYTPNGKAVEDIYKNYIPNGKFGFNGEIIKISAIDGKREVSGFDENKKAIFAFNCPSNAWVSFGIETTPFIKQIEEITGVKLVTPPPSEEAALKRMAEILDVPEELLVFEGGQVKLTGRIINFISGSGFSSYNTTTTTSNPLANRLEGVIPFVSGFNGSQVTVDQKVIKGVQNYKFDTSPEAQQRRKEIALKPWDK
ncbi:MAG: hypothetical protein K5766_01535 [Alphaproteobacteria bacterium]|nr:hypothetical protein [Alphaproteobacteria bacterium]